MNSDLIYKQKYHKYKEKYLRLKTKLYGGNDSTPSTQSTPSTYSTSFSNNSTPYRNNSIPSRNNSTPSRNNSIPSRLFGDISPINNNSTPSRLFGDISPISNFSLISNENNERKDEYEIESKEEFITPFSLKIWTLNYLVFSSYLFIKSSACINK